MSSTQSTLLELIEKVEDDEIYWILRKLRNKIDKIKNDETYWDVITLCFDISEPKRPHKPLSRTSLFKERIP